MRQRFESEDSYRQRHRGFFQPGLHFSSGVAGAFWLLGLGIGLLGLWIGFKGFEAGTEGWSWFSIAAAVLGCGIVTLSVRNWQGDLRWVGWGLGCLPVLLVVLSILGRTTG